MESSRIFIKGLPPSITEEEFKRHFSSRQPITDAKLIAHRRIGYVGYKTPDDAQKAVKYFNRSFIRMSRIGVELARPISDTALPPSRKQQRELEREAQRERAAAKEAKAAALAAEPSLKRKRAEAEAADPKLQEFLEIMQPPSKAKTFDPKSEVEEPPVKMQARELPGGESDDEYEAVPKKARKQSPVATAAPEPAATTTVPAVPSAEPAKPGVVEVTAEDVPSADAAETAQPSVGQDATDDDWLKSRTNRLLDLVDPEEAVAANANAPSNADGQTVDEKAPAEADSHDVEMKDEETPTQQPSAEKPSPQEPAAESTDATIEAIRRSGRLFGRNLPYTATEDDLRAHFEKYGALEEVRFELISFSILAFVMIIQIGTAYAISK